MDKHCMQNSKEVQIRTIQVGYFLLSQFEILTEDRTKPKVYSYTLSKKNQVIYLADKTNDMKLIMAGVPRSVEFQTKLSQIKKQHIACTLTIYFIYLIYIVQH